MLRRIRGINRRNRPNDEQIRHDRIIQNTVRWIGIERRYWRDHVEKMGPEGLAKWAKSTELSGISSQVMWKLDIQLAREELRNNIYSTLQRKRRRRRTERVRTTEVRMLRATRRVNRKDKLSDEQVRHNCIIQGIVRWMERLRWRNHIERPEELAKWVRTQKLQTSLEIKEMARKLDV